MRILKRRPLAMTLVEMLIAVTIFTMVGTFVAVVSLAIARETKKSLSLLPAEQQSYRALDFVRRELLPAEFGTLDIAEDQMSIRYRTVNSGVTREIRFDPELKKCLYLPNVDEQDNVVEWGRNIEGRFAILDTPRHVRVSCWSIGKDGYNDPRRMVYVDDLTVRN